MKSKTTAEMGGRKIGGEACTKVGVSEGGRIGRVEEEDLKSKVLLQGSLGGVKKGGEDEMREEE